MGNESERVTNKSRQNANRFSGDLFVPRSDSFPMNQEKRHSFLIFTMLPSNTSSKIPREKLLHVIQNSCSNGHLTFDALIITHAICPTAELLVDRGLSGIDLKTFSRV